MVKEYNVGTVQFGDVFYSIIDNKLATWKVDGVYFQNYNRDMWNNTCALTGNAFPDVEYRLVRWNNHQLEEAIAHKNNIGNYFFKTKEELYKSMEE